MHSQRAAPELFQGTELFVNIPGISAAEKELSGSAHIDAGIGKSFPHICGNDFRDLKFTYCFCADMHEIVKYFILTEIQ